MSAYTVADGRTVRVSDGDVAAVHRVEPELWAVPVGPLPVVRNGPVDVTEDVDALGDGGVDGAPRLRVADVGGLRDRLAGDDLLAVVVEPQEVEPVLDLVGDGEVHEHSRKSITAGPSHGSLPSRIWARAAMPTYGPPAAQRVHLVDVRVGQVVRARQVVDRRLDGSLVPLQRLEHDLEVV